MKQTKLRAVSTKRAAQNEQYRRLSLSLEIMSDCECEWCGVFGVENHHIDGRRGARLLDPFNIIRLCRRCHTVFQAHNSWEVREALKLWVYGLRIQQGFLPND